jgi:hypothetical protein
VAEVEAELTAARNRKRVMEPVKGPTMTTAEYEAALQNVPAMKKLFPITSSDPLSFGACLMLADMPFPAAAVMPETARVLQREAMTQLARRPIDELDRLVNTKPSVRPLLDNTFRDKMLARLPAVERKVLHTAFADLTGDGEAWSRLHPFDDLTGTEMKTAVDVAERVKREGLQAISRDERLLILRAGGADFVERMLGGKLPTVPVAPKVPLLAAIAIAPMPREIDRAVPKPSNHSPAVAPQPREIYWKIPLSGYSSEWQTVGAVDVRVAGLSITKVPIIDSKESVTESKNPMLVIIIEIRKNTPKKDRTLLSWQQFKGNTVSGYSPVVIYQTDDKELQPARLSGKLHAGLLEKQPIPDDGTSVRDILLFNVPADNAGKLRLRLDAERCGERGDIWFDLPALSWKKK